MTARAAGGLGPLSRGILVPGRRCLYFYAGRAKPPRLPATMWRHLKNFLLFLREEKAWWLVPLVVILLLLAGVLVFNSSSALAPLMYPVR